MHWDPDSDANLAGYKVYRASASGGPFVAQGSVLTTPGFCDLSVGVVNGHTNFYQVTALTTTSQESPPSITVSTVPNLFASNDAFLDYVQQANFDWPATRVLGESGQWSRPGPDGEQFNSLGLR